MPLTRRRAATAAAGLACAAGLTLSLALPVRAATSRSFDAFAAADGARQQVISPGAALSDTVVDTGGPTAQARLSSVGRSTGFAAYPDPGATVLGAPSTAGTSAVSYPLAVTSSYPVTPDAALTPGPYELTASSRQASSDASASSGAPDHSAALVSAQAHVRFAAETVTATSESDDRSLMTGPLTIGRVRATATVTQGPDGPATRSSTFDVSGLEAGGAALGVGPGGLTVAGTTTPLPDSSPVRSLLSGAGISVAYIAPTRTANGAVSAGLQITVAGAGGQQSIFVLGRASARIVHAQSDEGGVPPPMSGVPAPPGPIGPTSSPGGGIAPPTALTHGPLPPGVVQPQVQAPAAAPPVQSNLLLRRVDVVGWPRSFFLVLAAGGLLAVLTSLLFSALGVRRP